MKYDSSTQEILYGLKEISRNFKLESYSSKSKNIPASTNFTPGNYGSYRLRVFKYNNKLYIIGVNYSTTKACMAVINLDTEEYSEVDLYTTMGLTSSSYRPSAYLMAQDNNYVYMIYPSYSNKLHRLNFDDNTKVETTLATIRLLASKYLKYLQTGIAILTLI